MLDKFADLLVEELQINRKDITMDAELSNDLGINSIELADLVMLCEDKFGIVIEDDDIRGWRRACCNAAREMAAQAFAR